MIDIVLTYADYEDRTKDFTRERMVASVPRVGDVISLDTPWAARVAFEVQDVTHVFDDYKCYRIEVTLV